MCTFSLVKKKAVVFRGFVTLLPDLFKNSLRTVGFFFFLHVFVLTK